MSEATRPKNRYVCITCRSVGHASTCTSCGNDDLLTVGPYWRAPKKHDDRSWKRIERSEVMWDRKAISSGRKRDRARRTFEPDVEMLHQQTSTSAYRSLRATCASAGGRFTLRRRCIIEIDLPHQITGDVAARIGRDLARLSTYPRYFIVRLRGTQVTRDRFVSIVKQYVDIEPDRFSSRDPGAFTFSQATRSARLRATVA